MGDMFGECIVISVYENKYRVAKHMTVDAYAVWNIDPASFGVHLGMYFDKKSDAEKEFASRCFDWFNCEMEDKDVHNRLERCACCN